MKQTLIATLIAAGVMLGSASSVLAAGGGLAIILQNPIGTRALNPQPEPPGVTDTAARPDSLQLNPQPEPPGVAYNKLKTSTSSVATSSMKCTMTVEQAKQKAHALAKVAYDKAVKAAVQAKDKMLAYAKTLTDKDPKKAAILKAQSNFNSALSKAKQARNAAYDAAEIVYQRALRACKAPIR